jgi:hypothetical protein
MEENTGTWQIAAIHTVTDRGLSFRLRTGYRGCLTGWGNRCNTSGRGLYNRPGGRFGRAGGEQFTAHLPHHRKRQFLKLTHYLNVTFSSRVLISPGAQ